MMIEFEGRSYFDDRVFVVEVTSVTARGLGGGGLPVTKWAVITRRNVLGYPPTRVDDFDTREEAEAYADEVEPTTPRVSLGGKSPVPPPTLVEYHEWLVSIGATTTRGK
jgi:hypothetical protein